MESMESNNHTTPVTLQQQYKFSEHEETNSPLTSSEPISPSIHYEEVSSEIWSSSGDALTQDCIEWDESNNLDLRKLTKETKDDDDNDPILHHHPIVGREQEGHDIEEMRRMVPINNTYTNHKNVATEEEWNKHDDDSQTPRKTNVTIQRNQSDNLVSSLHHHESSSSSSYRVIAAGRRRKRWRQESTSTTTAPSTSKTTTDGSTLVVKKITKSIATNESSC
jgi:hypothetical protein